MRQEGDDERRQGQGKPEIATERAHMACDRDSGAARRDGGEDRKQRRQHNRRENEDGPDESRIKRQRPSHEQGENGHRG